MKEIIQGKKNSLNIGEKTPRMYFHVCLRNKWQWEAVVTQGNFQASTGPSFRRHAVISTPSTRKRPYQQNPPSDNHQRLQKIQIKTVTIAQLSPSHAMLHKRGNNCGVENRNMHRIPALSFTLHFHALSVSSHQHQPLQTTSLDH